MSDGQLSQEEIDALLGHQTEDAKQSAQQEKNVDAQPSSPEKGPMSELEEDVLGEIGNISFGSAATALSTILNQKVEITTPEVHIVNRNKLGEEFPVPHVSVLVNYTEGFQGSCMLVIRTRDASVIADLMMGGDGKKPSTEINEMQMSAVQEAMNQMMGSSSTAMSTVFNRRIDISPPELTLMDLKTRRGIENIPDDALMFEISFRLTIGNLVDSNIMQLVPIPFGKQLVDLLMSENADEKEQQEVVTQEPSAAPTVAETADAPVSPASSASQDDRDKKVKERVSATAESKNVVHPKNVQTAEFSEFGSTSLQSEESAPRNLDLLMDIPLDVSVELGRTRKTVREVLELGPGSIIELDKLAGEAIDILVNQKYVAKGEVVVVDENFGIRITEILNHAERLKSL